MANVAFILADLYEDSEFTEPWQRLQEAGHQTAAIGRRRGAEVKGKKGHRLGGCRTTTCPPQPSKKDDRIGRRFGA